MDNLTVTPERLHEAHMDQTYGAKHHVFMPDQKHRSSKSQSFLLMQDWMNELYLRSGDLGKKVCVPAAEPSLSETTQEKGSFPKRQTEV